MNNKKIIVFVLSILLLIISILLLSDDIFSPYVSFKYAQEHPDKYVQIIGKRDKNVDIILNNSGFSFTLVDNKGNNLNTYSHGIKPLNFEHVDQVVVLGKFNTKKNIFEADKLLVKCPSKYQKENK